MTRKLDPSGELKALGDAIAKKQADIDALEEVVVLNTLIPTEEERRAIQRKIAEYEAVLNSYNVTLAANELPISPRPQVTRDFIQRLFDRSQDIKTRRDKLQKEVDQLQAEFDRRSKEVDQARENAQSSLVARKEAVARMRGELQRLADELKGCNKCSSVVSYAKSLRKNRSEFYPDPVNALTVKVASMIEERAKAEKAVNAGIEGVKKGIDDETKGQQALSKSGSAAKRAYETSVKSKKDAERVCKQEKERMKTVRDAVGKNVKKGSTWSKSLVAKNADRFNLSRKLSARVDEACKKFKAMKKPELRTQAVVLGEINSGEFSFTNPQELKDYASMRKKAMSKIDPAEFRFFLVSETDLLKWYKIVKANYTKTKAKYTVERKTAADSVAAAQVKYNMIMKRVTRAGLEPLT